MSEGNKMPLVRAKQLADTLVADLSPGCLRIEVAGSIRRRKPEVGDLEIVAVPKLSHDLLGQPDGGTFLNPLLKKLVDAGHLRAIKGGDKYKQYELPAHGCKLDLFLTTEDQWGLILLIRTGPSDFSRRFVTQQYHGGFLPCDLHVAGGRLWRGVYALPTPEEADAFRHAGLEWIEPWDR